MNILIIDDHPSMLAIVKELTQSQFSDANIITVTNAFDALRQLEDQAKEWKLVIVDLSIPKNEQNKATSETGLELLSEIMKLYKELNLMVYSSNIKVLVQIKQHIDQHQGGFTIVDKNAEIAEVKRRMQCSADGYTITRDIRKGLELKPEWMAVLKLANEGLQDKAIAEKLHVTERAVRHYWSKLQDILEIYVEGEDKMNLRILTLKRAREEGLID